MSWGPRGEWWDSGRGSAQSAHSFPFPKGPQTWSPAHPTQVSRHPCDFLCLDPVPDITSLLERILSRKLPAQTQTCH